MKGQAMLNKRSLEGLTGAADDVASADAAAWYVLRVRHHSEFCAGQYLASRGYEYLVPAKTVTRQSPTRQMPSLTPLFHGIVFCRFEAKDAGRILACPAVLSIVLAGDRLAAVSEAEIAALQSFKKNDLAVSAGTRPIDRQAVVVTEGPLTGVQGCVERGVADRLHVHIGLLERSVCVNVPADTLEKVWH